MGKAAAATGAALPSPTYARDVLLFTWVRLQKPLKRRYLVPPVHVMF